MTKGNHNQGTPLLVDERIRSRHIVEHESELRAPHLERRRAKGGHGANRRSAYDNHR